jgi:hypothetical protein
MSSRRYQRRNVVACGNCGANYDASGPDPRCPACNARLEDYEPAEARPAVRGYGRDHGNDLEGPDLMRRHDEPPETAPIEEFVAAGFVLLAFILIVAGIFMASPLVLNLGLILFAIAGIGFGLFKLYLRMTGKQKRRDDAYEAPSMFDWLIGRGFWDRWR